MNRILRRLKIQELSARIFLYDLERESHIRELTSPAPDNDRRAALYRHLTRLEDEHTMAIHDLEWFQAEERLGRPDRKFKPDSLYRVQKCKEMAASCMVRMASKSKSEN